MTAFPYIEHLTDNDLNLLVTVTPYLHSVDDLLAQLREAPDALEALLQQPRVFEELFAAGEEGALLRASPFLIFAVLVQRTARDLESAHFVREWIGPGQRIPMFEVSGPREFAGSPLRRLFLVELLTSYTHVASGSLWVQTPWGWRRRRYSEMDPLRLLELIGIVPAAERPALYHRLGDLALFLTGVFPDYTARRLFPSVRRDRLRRAAALLSGHTDSPGAREENIVSLLEDVGRRAYGMAWRESARGAAPVLHDLVEGFGQARRVLNHLTDGYLFPVRSAWFGVSEG